MNLLITKDDDSAAEDLLEATSTQALINSSIVHDGRQNCFITLTLPLTWVGDHCFTGESLLHVLARSVSKDQPAVFRAILGCKHLDQVTEDTFSLSDENS